MHWAAPLIGTPWTPEHNCWWFVQLYFKRKHGIDMPLVHVGHQIDESQVVAIMQAARSSGWAPVEDAPLEDDVVLMRDQFNERHIGVMTFANRALGVIHCSGSVDKTSGKPFGSVVFESLDDMRRTGCRGFEFWRRVT